MKRLLAILIIGAIVYFLVFVGVIHHKGTIDDTQEADVIIVLGAGLLRDGRPGPAQTRRSQQGAELWRAGIADFVICTGGQAETYPRSEAAACREILLRSSVPANAILLEEQSRSTEENASYSKLILDEMGMSNAVLVSDSFHMLRANWLFGRQGIRTYASPVPANRIRDPLYYPYSLLREFLAFHWYFLKETLGLPQTHLSGV